MLSYSVFFLQLQYIKFRNFSILYEFATEKESLSPKYLARSYHQNFESKDIKQLQLKTEMPNKLCIKMNFDWNHSVWANLLPINDYIFKSVSSSKIE